MRVLLVFLHPSLRGDSLTLRTIGTPAVSRLGRGAAAAPPLAEGVLHRALVVAIHADLLEEEKYRSFVSLTQRTARGRFCVSALITAAQRVHQGPAGGGGNIKRGTGGQDTPPQGQLQPFNTLQMNSK